MSRRHRRQRQAGNFPWVLAAFGGVLIIAAIVLFANQGGGGGTPAIAVDPQKIDYGYVKFGNDETFSIKVTNTGTGTLRFAAEPYIEVLEGC